MAFTTEDRAYLDARFDRICDAIEIHRSRAEDRMNSHSTKINAVSVDAVKAVVEHEGKYHDEAKKWGIIAGITSIASAVGGGIAWALNKLGGGEK